MPSTTSWFNKEILLQSFRNVGWIGIIYFVGLFFAIPLQVLMTWAKQNNLKTPIYYGHYHNVFSFLLDIQVVLMIAVPILLSIFLFRYLQTKSASDFMHSLPIKRTTIYSQYVSVGILFLVVPVVLNAIVLIALNLSLDLEAFYTISQVCSWAGITIVFLLLIYLAGVTVGTFTGISVVQGVLTLILLFFPIGIMNLIVVCLDLFLFGFASNYYLGFNSFKLSPITNVAEFATLRHGISLFEIMIYLFITVICYGLGMWIYKKRQLETVTQAIVFPLLRPVFKYTVTFCMMLICGYYFGDTQNSMAWAVFGYIIGSLIGYFIAEMLLQKTWRVFTHVKGYFIYAVAIAVLGFIIHFDVTGFQQRVPEITQIQRVYFANNSFDYTAKSQNEDSNIVYIDYPLDKYKPYFYDPKNIENIKDLQRFIIKNRDALAHIKGPTQGVFIAYELKNGTKVVRDYRVPISEPYNTYLNKIYSSKEYKEAEFEVLHVQPNQVSLIRVSPNQPNSRSFVISDTKVIAKAISALKTDIMEDNTFNHPNFKDSHSTIIISLNSDKHEEIIMQDKPSYKRFEKILTEQ